MIKYGSVAAGYRSTAMELLKEVDAA